MRPIIDFNKLTLREKLLQLFIVGFEGTSFNSDNKLFQELLKEGLGGVIFFAQNFEKREGFKNLVNKINDLVSIPPFLSIDQEGGLVERTIKLDKKVDYLTPMALSAVNSPEIIKKHYQIMSEDLLDLGINMNFAPVLDVNTNKNNPVIGVRSLGSDTKTVSLLSKSIYETFRENKIIPVGKHFPGHGEAFVDSHLDMPEIDLSFEELEKVHIAPFIDSINNDIEAFMIAHVHYKAFNSEKLPASMSKEVITTYLKEKLGYKGLIISDDMVMGGVSKYFGLYESIVKGINAGIDLFIFKDTTQDLYDCINRLENDVKKGLLPEDRINESVKKILSFKKEFCTSAKVRKETFDIASSQKTIDKIAKDTVRVVKKNNLIPLDTNKKYLVLSPAKSNIFNLSFDKGQLADMLSEFLPSIKVDEIIYPLNPTDKDIIEISKKIEYYDSCIFLSYNAIFNTAQTELYRALSVPTIVVTSGVPYDSNLFKDANCILQINCYKPPSLKAVAKKICTL